MALAGPSVASPAPDPLSAHRAFLAGVRDRQRTRRAKVDAARRGNGTSGAGPSSAPATGRSTPAPAREHTTSPPAQSTSTAAHSSTSSRQIANYVPREEAVRNDYAAWYAVSGEWPSNFVLGAAEGEICEEFPALHRLMALKASHVAASAHPPLLAPVTAPAPASVLGALSPHRFDVILLHEPRSWGGTWADVASLPVRQLSADPSFVFLWVGGGDAHGLERGRECLAKWGFRRAEDIVWVKTNKGAVRRDHGDDNDDNASGEKPNPGGASSGLFASQKEHCLMGIRGTVRRSTDVHFVHCNVDTDVIVWEGDVDAPRTPPYLYTLIENFCLGARRLELFGDPARARQGWVTAPLVPEGAVSLSGALGLATGPRTAAPSLDALKIPDTAERFDTNTYPLQLPRKKEEGKPVLPFHAEIETLRPKSPQRGRGRKNGGGGGTQPGSGPSSPPPGAGGGNTPRFNAGVMRMGALTPAQAMTPALTPQQQHQHAQAMAIAMGGAGMHPGMANPLMGLNPMQMQAQMAMAQGMLNPMQMQMMGMGGMPMFNGAMGGGMGPMGMGMHGMMPMMGGGMAPMGGMGNMGMGMAGMGEMAGMMADQSMMQQAGGGSGAMSPMSGATSPRLAHAQAHAHAHGHGHASPDPNTAYAEVSGTGEDEWGSPVRQLAAGMGAMAMPYAAEGYDGGYDAYAHGNGHGHGHGHGHGFYGYGYQQQ